ncbi:MAG: T9SS type A sorting domain-containing protein [Bacteroidales bacterium]
MKKSILFILFILFHFGLKAQSEISELRVAPDWTLTDIEGKEHNMYDYLEKGYTVFIDFSTVWCSPCWNYHKTNSLEELFANHGPKGYSGVSENTTDDVMVFFIEGSKATVAQLKGEKPSLGNWVEGTPYPIITTSDPNNDKVLSDYGIVSFPRVFKVCQNRFLSLAGTLTAEKLYAQVLDGCDNVGDYAQNAKLFNLRFVDHENCSGELKPRVMLQNYGSEVLKKLDITYSVDGVNRKLDWTGYLEQYDYEFIDLLPFYNIKEGAQTFMVKSSKPNSVEDEYLDNDILIKDFTVDYSKKEVILEIKTDDHPEENNWELYYNGKLIKSGEGFLKKQTIYQIPICIESDKYYRLKFVDAKGNGLQSGDAGWGTLKYNDNVLGKFDSEFSMFSAIDFTVQSSAIDETEKSIPVEVYPNPVEKDLNIVLDLEKENQIKIYIHNVLGEKIMEREEKKYPPGENTISVDMHSLDAGIYFLVLKIGNETSVKKLVLSN